MRKLLVILLIIKVFVFTTLPAQATDSENIDKMYSPEHVVLALLSAMEANNGPRIRSLFANNATQNYERWYAMQKRGDKFRAWLESDIIEVQGRVVAPKFNVDGERVIVTGTYINNNDYKSAADFLFIVKDGKILSWTMRYD